MYTGGLTSWAYIFAFSSLTGFMACSTPFQIWLLMEVLLFMFLALIEESWFKSSDSTTKSLMTFFVVQFLGSAVSLVLLSIKHSEACQVIGKVGLTIAIFFDMGCPPFFWLSSWAYKSSLINFFWFSTFMKILPLKLLFMVNDHLTLVSLVWVGGIYQIYNMGLDIAKLQSTKRWAVTLFVHSSYTSTLFLCFSAQFPNTVWLSYLVIFFVLSLSAILWSDASTWMGSGFNLGYTFGIKPWITLLNLVGFPPSIIFFKKLQFFHMVAESASISSDVFNLNMTLSVMLMIHSAVLIFLTACVWWKSACHLDKGSIGSESGCPLYLATQMVIFVGVLSTISYLGFLFF